MMAQKLTLALFNRRVRSLIRGGCLVLSFVESHGGLSAIFWESVLTPVEHKMLSHGEGGLGPLGGGKM